MPPEPPRPAALLWDWDNTLVDGWAAIQHGLNAAFRAFGLPEWDRETVLRNVRRSLRESFPEIFGAEWERARDIFYAGVRARHLEVLRPMPAAESAILAAAAVGLPQGVISNKQGPLLRAEAAHLGWAPHFRILLGAGDAAADKPDPAPFRLAFPALGIPLGPTIWYVGDTALDMQAARAAGCTAVLLGDAAHDGGVANIAPDLAFPDAAALAAWLREPPAR
ncbi:HAD family hydrolase [Siccirubricoccus sp. KC 17139]|uniref:phosphoglycolate phosphatase n=1 Tax=Siccirubricoccus soli TaxID=2899147 RepID=A0ABT1D2U6_9PROT|nr:HAD family hydrolase [Siccirubricoccus soli]MCO6416241.1 HAD family hydrolase [Siccirubricoccus soli]MCP2682375.1 HAD family hydrolase [Siccirubricoccus soli]